MDYNNETKYEIEEKTKKRFLEWWKRETNDKGYYNWTETDNKLIQMTIEEVIKRSK